MDDRYLYIYGRHAVTEALTHKPEVISGLFLRHDIKQQLSRSLIANVKFVNTFTGDNVPKEVDPKSVHQGMIAQIDKHKLVLSYENFKEDLQVTTDTCIAILGEVQDPHNVGAVIRSAAAFGVSAVLIPKHRQAGVTNAVVKVSAGMTFKIPLVEIGNVNRAIEDLKRVGFFAYGLDGSGDVCVTDEQFTKPTIFILGNEASGIREKTKDHCDIIINIPIHPRCESLNASVSASIAFYQWSTQHTNSLKL